MTKEECKGLYDQLYWGHEIELSVGGRRYYLEQGDGAISVYLMETNPGIKIADIAAQNRNSLVEQTLTCPCFQGKSIEDHFMEIELIAID